MSEVDVLIPTCGRKTGLVAVLTSLLGQTFTEFNVIISDQTEDERYLDSAEIATIIRALEWHGHTVQYNRHLPRRGMAEQRNHLLNQSRARYVHFIDDDVLLAPEVMDRMIHVIRSEQYGFVGCAATGLEHVDDVRPHEQNIELWNGRVQPEAFGSDWLPGIGTK